jgi:hypothetical protein
MSQTIKIKVSSETYSRLKKHAEGFDVPENVIVKMLNYYEGITTTSAETSLNNIGNLSRLFSNKEIQEKISQAARKIPEDELNQLCNEQVSKEIFDIDFPLFIKCPKNMSKTAKRNVVKDELGRNRWTWKFEFERNGFLYAITTQWFQRHDIKVQEWLKSK